jgi:transglutaminase/protease-like cytokinesis protein 3
MPKVFFLLFSLFLTANAIAQENIYDILGMDMVDTSDYEGKLMFYEEMPFNLLNKAEVDAKIDIEIEHAKTMHFKTLGDLNAYLAKHKTTEYQKIRAFFVWIERNIEFDLHSYQTNHIPPQNAMVVYMGRRALSKGYADLFTLFCQNNEIECRTLKGYTKGFDIEKEHKDYPNHFWNAVRIDNYWYLLDIPMCIGKIENKKFTKIYKDDYFLAPPVEFIKSHLPIHSSWQLLETHIELNDFYNQK